MKGILIDSVPQSEPIIAALQEITRAATRWHRHYPDHQVYFTAALAEYLSAIFARETTDVLTTFQQTLRARTAARKRRR